MRDDRRDLYQSVILDHARSPRNFRRLEGGSLSAYGHNPMCGDQLTVFLRLDESGFIAEAAFEGHGCAIALASGSLMTEVLRGRTPRQAERLLAAFEAMCGSDSFDEAAFPDEDRAALQHLQVLSGVRAFPVRIRCATLAWHTMSAALHGVKEASSG
ncbi:MAG TPA: SUF system NifU family Fe-S cluster assembly protein [Rhodospirillales bacterium]|nr:SUF system NifU family Fe-S cluster assembly protein [Rhodospirillales bacterium]